MDCWDLKFWEALNIINNKLILKMALDVATLISQIRAKVGNCIIPRFALESDHKVI